MIKLQIDGNRIETTTFHLIALFHFELINKRDIKTFLINLLTNDRQLNAPTVFRVQTTSNDISNSATTRINFKYFFEKARRTWRCGEEIVEKALMINF